MSEMKPGKSLDIEFARLIGYIPVCNAIQRDGTVGVYPQYSTTWKGMRFVVEEMQRRGWKFVLILKGAEFGAGFSKGDVRIAETSDSAPYAVTMAAQRALKAED